MIFILILIFIGLVLWGANDYRKNDYIFNELIYRWLIPSSLIFFFSFLWILLISTGIEGSIIPFGIIFIFIGSIIIICGLAVVDTIRIKETKKKILLYKTKNIIEESKDVENIIEHRCLICGMKIKESGFSFCPNCGFEFKKKY